MSGVLESLPTNRSFVITSAWKRTPFKLEKTPDDFVVRTRSLAVRVEKAGGAVTFLDATGKVLLAEKPGTRALTSLGGFFTAEDSFASPPDERLHGLGQYDCLFGHGRIVGSERVVSR